MAKDITLLIDADADERYNHLDYDYDSHFSTSITIPLLRVDHVS